ncbi:hypothetical protein Trydic_g1134 [Trypoxylus dichotomus]
MHLPYEQPLRSATWVSFRRSRTRCYDPQRSLTLFVALPADSSTEQWTIGTPSCRRPRTMTPGSSGNIISLGHSSWTIRTDRPDVSRVSPPSRIQFFRAKVSVAGSSSELHQDVKETTFPLRRNKNSLEPKVDRQFGRSSEFHQDKLVLHKYTSPIVHRETLVNSRSLTV